LQADQFLRGRSYPIDVIAGPTKVHPRVAAIDPTEARKRLNERRDVTIPAFDARRPIIGTDRAWFARVDGNKLTVKSQAIFIPTSGLTSSVQLEYMKVD
jgi:hypothetical protein